MSERNPDACHISCGDTFSWYNNSIFFCQKGCDYALGKVYDPATRYFLLESILKNYLCFGEFSCEFLS